MSVLERFYYVVIANDVKTVRELIKNGVDPTLWCLRPYCSKPITPIRAAVNHRAFDVVRVLIQHGCSMPKYLWVDSDISDQRFVKNITIYIKRINNGGFCIEDFYDEAERKLTSFQEALRIQTRYQGAFFVALAFRSALGRDVANMIASLVWYGK